ncbi:MAG: dockerin type I repeat-containing protein, partial [Verrucomicrobiota bacterium]|nr:dockerin type I repeat-containing protein [Verrucomicrobiota bacterium]
GYGSSRHTLVLTFNNDILSAAAAVTTTSGNASAFVSEGKVFVTLSNVANAQTVTVQLGAVTDYFAQTSSGATIAVGFLMGDVNGDGVVNSADATIVRNRSGQSVDAANFRCDINLDSSINSADATSVRSKSGQSLSRADLPIRRVTAR